MPHNDKPDLDMKSEQELKEHLRSLIEKIKPGTQHEELFGCPVGKEIL